MKTPIRTWVNALAIAASMVLLISSHTANAQNVGIGTPTPGSKLSVAGNAVIGSGYAGLAGPTDGLAVQGNVGIGTAAPGAKLQINASEVTALDNEWANHPLEIWGSDQMLDIGVNSTQRVAYFQSVDVGTAPSNIALNPRGGSVGIGTTAPVASAQLDVTSSNKGVIFPRIALTSAIDASTVPGVVDGILVYNTATAGTGQNAISPGYYYWQNNRWNKLQTSGYAGVIFGVHNPTLPNDLTTIAPNWQYTGSYIDLPPGKWVVYIYQLISPQNGSSHGWDGNGLDRALWVRTTLSNSNTTFSTSPHIIGSPLASGSVVAPSLYGMVAGAIYINNNTGSTTRYYLWAQFDRYGGTNCNVRNFATNSWGENQFFAVPAE